MAVQGFFKGQCPSILFTIWVFDRNMWRGLVELRYLSNSEPASVWVKSIWLLWFFMCKSKLQIQATSHKKGIKVIKNKCLTHTFTTFEYNIQKIDSSFETFAAQNCIRNNIKQLDGANRADSHRHYSELKDQTRCFLAAWVKLWSKQGYNILMSTWFFSLQFWAFE